jgi:hypothetical protein
LRFGADSTAFCCKTQHVLVHITSFFGKNREKAPKNDEEIRIKALRDWWRIKLRLVVVKIHKHTKYNAF